MGSRDSTEDDPRLPTNDWDDLDEDAFVALAARAAGYLLPGDIVVFRGEVGAGKTTFVRTAARALSVREAVTSPTYQFARGYEGSAGGSAIWVNHLDLYRLEGLDVRDALELDEYLQPDSIAFIEWADPALGLLKDPSVVELSHRSPETRRVRISGPLATRLSPTKC